MESVLRKANTDRSAIPETEVANVMMLMIIVIMTTMMEITRLCHQGKDDIIMTMIMA